MEDLSREGMGGLCFHAALVGIGGAEVMHPRSALRRARSAHPRFLLTSYSA